MCDLAEEIQKSKKEYEKGGHGTILNGLRPCDCKHCYGASCGVMGIHYACDKGHIGYPFIMCSDECRDYDKEIVQERISMDTNPKIIERHKQMQEANKIMENLSNNMLNSFDDIADDILKQKNHAIAMAFTVQIGKLLRKNGVVASYAIHEHYETQEDAFTKHYGVVFDSIDFSEHDKEFLEEIEKLKSRIDDLNTKMLTMVDIQPLPSEPIQLAQTLICSASEAEENGNIYFEPHKAYNKSQLKQIAEHLLVYCDSNKDEG